MKRTFIALTLLLLAALLLAVPPGVIDASTSHTYQVTIGASATQIVTSTAYVRQVSFQNNALHAMRIGDANVSSTRGALIASGGGSYTVGPLQDAAIDLSTFYVSGTQNDILDVIVIN